MDSGVYFLGPGDEIRVDVFNEPTLSGTYTVDPSGSVSLPLIGQQQASGQSLRQFEGEITKALNHYLINPRVNLDLAKFRPFYIHGEVTNGGEYPYASGMHVLTAIGMAGGYTYRANKKRIYIIRQGSGEEVEFKATVNTRILPGDVVRIPERRF
jgi:polysaccharide export outer membrane protein